MRRQLSSACVIVAVLAGSILIAVRTRASGGAPNVLIITLDTTRADRLPPYGFQSASMPAIERLAREGVVFLQAVTVAPLTLPAHCSLLTGLYPPHHGVRDNADPVADAVHSTLAEVLRSRGFETAAFVGAAVLNADRGLARGFQTYRDTRAAHVTASIPRRPANEVVDDALTWLNAHDRSRFFVWVHLYDAHAPYRPPEPYRSRFVADPYEGSLAFMDAQVGRLMQWLESHELLTRTLIVAAGDHGESLGDHHELEHGFFLYDSVLRVPLIIRGPRIPPRRVTAVASLVDVMPTILGLLNFRQIVSDGVDMTGVIRANAPAPERAVYAESMYPQRFGLAGLRSIRDRDLKFVDAPRPELYDLRADPLEEHNVYGLDSANAAALAVRLNTFAGLRGDATASASVPADLRERLAALGYVAGTAAAAATRDPKDYIEMYNASRRDRSLRAPWGK